MYFIYSETTMTVHEKDQLKINFEVERLPDASYEILMSAYNFSNSHTLENFILQAAVPKVHLSQCMYVSGSPPVIICDPSMSPYTVLIKKICENCVGLFKF